MRDYASPEVLESELLLTTSGENWPSVAPTGTGRRRLSRADWVEAATEELAAHGFPALAATSAAQRLGVPEKSFATHFESHDDLVEAVLQRWKALDTDELVESLDRIADPRVRLARFVESAFQRHRSGRVFAALCGTPSHLRVRSVMALVREARLACLERALTELGLSPRRARDRAVLIYTTYVGFWGLVADDPNLDDSNPRFLHRIAEHVKNTLIPSEP